MPRFRKLLIANRGEIACRVIRSARSKGYRTVAVFSDADAQGRHVVMADEAIRIGEPAVGKSYLDLDAIMAAARIAGADAIHPGYGFLSERVELAEACADAGIVFVGPSPEAIRVMGDKAASKWRMIEAGVLCAPGYQGEDQSDERFFVEATKIGFPVMVKATAGGGGRGMRLVETAETLGTALRAARSEAKGAFGDDRLLLERAVTEPRHVEIQVMGDRYGNIVHLGERDCSVQRRHQKVIEEAPSPAVDAELRATMGAAAVAAAAAIDYVGAGTVEFLLGADRQFYFLEMNTRLQVEHPVTEMITGLDLVAMQLDVAAGVPLAVTQTDIGFTGHAMEARLYAEDPAAGFLPQAGPVLRWEPAEGDSVRVDHGLLPADQVSPFYDPMIAKIIAHGPDREEARRRLIRAIEDSILFGIRTNREFLVATLETPEFADGQATTGFIGRHFPDGYNAEPPSFDVAALAAAILLRAAGEDRLRSNAWIARTVALAHGEIHFDLLAEGCEGGYRFLLGDEVRWVELLARSNGRMRCRIGDRIVEARFFIAKDQVHLDVAGRAYLFRDKTYAPPAVADSTASGILRAPMSGSIVAVDVAVGSRVVRGQALAVLEAMKMEHRITALADGVVESVAIVPGMQVGARDILIMLRADEAV